MKLFLIFSTVATMLVFTYYEDLDKSDAHVKTFFFKGFKKSYGGYGYERYAGYGEYGGFYIGYRGYPRYRGYHVGYRVYGVPVYGGHVHY